MSAEVVVCETNDAEKDGKDDETHELDGLAAHGVDEGNCDPITWDCTGADEDETADGCFVEDLVHGFPAVVTDRGQDNGVVETQTIESDIKEKP